MSATGNFGVTGIDLSGYMVKDARRAIAFYREVLGLEPILTYPEDRGAEYTLADGTTFGLWGGGGRVMPFSQATAFCSRLMTLKRQSQRWKSAAFQ